jgi:primosomal protein N' (replication factor Y)
MRALISGDREAFYAKEIEERERSTYPPFGRLAALIVSGGDKHETESYARKIAAALTAR